jgi:hypothetical protein
MPDAATVKEPSQDANTATPKLRSKKVIKRRRRFVTKDSEVIKITRISTAPVSWAPDVPLVRSNAPPKTIKHLFEESESGKATRVHSWAHTTDTGKVTAAIRVLKAAGRGCAFSLDLGPDEIKAANDNRKGFTDYFKRRISRALYDALGYVPAYVLAQGVAANDRLHSHGVIETNDNELEMVRRALEHAGGVWAHRRGQEHQCDIKPLYDPDVWADYCLRDCPKARRLIKGPAISITTPLRRRAEDLWSSYRSRSRSRA